MVIIQQYSHRCIFQHEQQPVVSVLICNQVNAGKKINSNFPLDVNIPVAFIKQVGILDARLIQIISSFILVNDSDENVKIQVTRYMI